MIIDKQDMEKLAAMVLSGDGQYLIGAKSSLPEIQAFIDNVPAYMVIKNSIFVLCCLKCAVVLLDLTNLLLSSWLLLSSSSRSSPNIEQNSPCTCSSERGKFARLTISP